MEIKEVLADDPGEVKPDAADRRDDVDPLLESLLILARAHGRVITRDAAMAGLPLERQAKLPPGLFARAANRADLACNIIQRPLDRLNPRLFPSVLILHGQDACVLLGFSEDGRQARVIFPELGDAAVSLPIEELAARYSGRAILARPRFAFDARAPEVGTVTGRHWFWGALADNLPLYRDVLLSAFLISLFAVAMPLFIMNVYDRVVPNHAFETLWVLAIGVAVVIMADVAARTMRGYFLDLASSRVDVKLSAYIMERVLGIRLENRPISAGSFAANLRSFETVRDFITSATVTAFIDLPFALVFLIVIGWIAWPVIIPIVSGMLIVLLYGPSGKSVGNGPVPRGTATL